MSLDVPKALWLADWLLETYKGREPQSPMNQQAAAELRRLHAENETLKTAVAAEREACAQIADQYHIPMAETFADAIAQDIRNRATP